ncbi:hypothetical protein GTP91_29035 [Rugamonas sp. FT82W]|uniref:Uncharacterized protein n=1 Tax=Duganella vulcania TaxID=2692166 RepID=A0A845GEF3_9BURK|nr:hypothetical protein [Duganella vulcania]MYM91207.1 hypothetical protein [Duganella vulcania]
MKLQLALCLFVAASAAPMVQAVEPVSLYQGLISFRDGPDPAGKTPVYWATSKTLYTIDSPQTATLKFGANWVAEIRWCGDRNGRPLPGECSDIYYNFRHGVDITKYTVNLLHP